MPAKADTIGPYRQIDFSGRGGTGIVYRARHRETGNLVALKTLHLPSETLLQSIRREIHGLSSVAHPGIVRILDQGIQDGFPW
ncbi:hypothetical protein ACFL27_19295 [candidate division CSSED10-310 bacterium]|uniref:Protein kinase domain-containing protein n=1 Tax=candidate division CSSED10-310 bacterium TaxID=2855610 RepID=A0ABV6Z1M1_UNCC1